jgi:hypothetical protein
MRDLKAPKESSRIRAFVRALRQFTKSSTNAGDRKALKKG